MISTARDNGGMQSPSQMDYYHSPTRNGKRGVLTPKTPEKKP